MIVIVLILHDQDHDLQPPEHLDGVDDTNVSVIKVVKSSQGERRQGPNQTK